MFYQTEWRHIQKDNKIHKHRREKKISVTKNILEYSFIPVSH
jgi:hypothetical protein